MIDQKNRRQNNTITVVDDIWDKATPFSLKATVKALKGDFAVLMLEKSGSEILWPLSNLPTGTKEGDEVPITIGSVKPDEAQRVEIARKMLEELVN